MPTRVTVPELSTVAMAGSETLQEGVEVVPERTTWNLGVEVALRVKSLRLRLSAALGAVLGWADGVEVPASAGASKLHRTIQLWEIWVPLRVAVMVALPRRRTFRCP